MNSCIVLNERIHVQMNLSKHLIYQEKSGLSYIVVDVNWTKWRHWKLSLTKLSALPDLYWQNLFFNIAMASLCKNLCYFIYAQGHFTFKNGFLL